MKRFITISALAVMLMAVTSTAMAVDLYQAGGDRLTALQNNDGGWDWPLDYGNRNAVSPLNTVGPIAMGLAQAYAHTGDADQLAALSKAGGLLLSKTTTFSPSDGYLAVALDAVSGTTTYTDYVKANFYDKLAAGTYNRKGLGTLYTTASFVQLIRDGRGGSQANLAAWDVGMGLYAAQAIGASTSEWIAGTKAEINELNGGTSAAPGNYDVIGLAGAVMGLASVGETAFDPTSGEHQSATSLRDLGDILATYQISSGGFAWNKNFVILNDLDESIQETAYAVLALDLLDHSRYESVISAAGQYLTALQLANGGWNGDEYYKEENNEVTGEALWASSVVPEPATLSLLALGGLALIRRNKK